MTEQPVETEQQFLGNENPAVVAVFPAGVYVPDSVPVEGLPLTEDQEAALRKARQHYVPNAHLRRPAWTPVDNVELTALARKSAAANRKLAIAKAESVKAEESLKLALDVENQAAEEVYAANEALVAFTRKDTGL